MSNYKFNIDNPEPDKGKIEKHKNFKKLKANYDDAVKPLYKKPLYKDKRTFLVILIIFLLAYIISEITEKEKKDIQQPKQGITDSTSSV